MRGPGVSPGEGLPSAALDGFWLPGALRERVLRGAGWETSFYRGGQPCSGELSGAVAVRWPRLDERRLRALLDGLQGGRASGTEAAARWESALRVIRGGMAEGSASLVTALAEVTPYSPEMLATALASGEVTETGGLAAALQYRPTWSVATRWEQMPDVPGWVRFFPAGRGAMAALRRRSPLGRPARAVDLTVGFAAGNVPGTAFLIVLLGSLANHVYGDGSMPAVLVRGSRHEPLLAPWVLSRIEAVDPGLVAGVAVLPWDYQDLTVQEEVMRRAGLVIATGDDGTMAALDAQGRRLAPGQRLHRHGHRVSFAACRYERSSPSLALRGALDSLLWDQNGCLSARVHFVLGDAEAYAEDLAEAMRGLSGAIPRGRAPLRPVHRAFDHYAALQGSGQVRVCSGYEDRCAVILDRRGWDGDTFRRAVDACQQRVVVVRPVADLDAVARCLRWLGAGTLQSLSAAVGESEGLDLAQAAGACGVTAVRPLGRAAFPRLAYSWDGRLPLDLGWVRPDGHFTTVEPDDPGPGLSVASGGVEGLGRMHPQGTAESGQASQRPGDQHHEGALGQHPDGQTAG